MQQIIKRADSYPLMRFYAKFSIDWDALLNTFDTSFLVTRLTIRDVVYSAGVLASEMLVNGQAA